MARYNGGICPCCRELFQDGDDVVVCPQCGTPHHRRCWQEYGACIHQDEHAQGYLWKNEELTAQPETAFDETNDLGLICPRCGTNSPKDSSFCNTCGFPFAKGREALSQAAELTQQVESKGLGTNSMYQTRLYPDVPGAFGKEIHSATMIGEKRAGEVAALVQFRSASYLPKFKALEEKKRRLIWNWPAFLLSFIAPGLWFLYRKLYRVGAVLVAVSFALTMVFAKPLSWYSELCMKITAYSVNGNPEQANAAINELLHGQIFRWVLLYLALYFLIAFFSGLFGTAVYHKEAWRKMGIYKEGGGSIPEYYRASLRELGGISLPGAIFSIVLPVFLSMIVSSIL